MGRGGDAAAGARGPASCRGGGRERRPVSVVLLLYLKNLKDLDNQGFLFYQLRLKEHYVIFNTFSTSAAEHIDGTWSLPQECRAQQFVTAVSAQSTGRD